MQCACAVICCHLWPVWLYYFFSTSSHKLSDFRKRVIKHKICVFVFSTTFVRIVFHSAWNSASYYHKRTYESRHSCY